MAKGSGPTEVEGSGTGGGGGGAITAPFGRKADAASVSTALSTEDVALFNSIITKLNGGLPAALGSGGGLKVEASVGETPYSFLSTAAVIAANLKASAGTFLSLEFFKKSAGAVYVRLYDKASAPGTGDTPIWRGMVPGSTAGDAGGFTIAFTNGLACTLGLGVRVTAAIADNDNTSLSANDVEGNVGYL